MGIILFTIIIIVVGLTTHAFYKRKQLPDGLFDKNTKKSFQKKFLVTTLSLIVLNTGLTIVYLKDDKIDNKKTNTQYLFLLDISNSMRTEDVKQLFNKTTSRLDYAKYIIKNIVHELNDNDEVALICFSDKTQTIVPFCADHQYLLTMTNAANPN